MKFKLPDLGENIESGDVTQVLVAVGDVVSEGQSVLEIEAGKATMEIPSPATGTVSAIHVEQGSSASVGMLVLEIEESGEAAPAEKTEAEPVTPAPEPEVKEDPVLEPPPAPTPAPAPEPEASIPEPPTVPSESSGLSSEPQAASPLPVSAAPNVRRLAREVGVDIHRVPATGPGGYVTVDDVKNFTKNNLRTKSAAWAGDAGERVEKMSAVRKATMNHMAHCWATIPHVTQHDLADITKLEALRKAYAPRAEAAGAKLTMTAILIKVIASALKNHPKFNCSIDVEKSEIIYKDYYNIGIAMDTPKGLLVPVVKDGDQKNFIELALELSALSEKAKAGKLSSGDMTGGTFTLTNLGGIGGSFFTPIVNAPEVAILGTGRAYWEPGIEDGQKHFRLPLSLSYDHRIIDGADGARFLKWIVEAVEEPMLLSLEG